VGDRIRIPINTWVEVWGSAYWMELPTYENTLPAFAPMSRTVLTTMTSTTASMTAYSAMSCPSSFDQSWVRRFRIIISQTAPDTAEAVVSGCMLEMKRLIPQPSFSCENACRPTWYSFLPSSSLVHTTVNSIFRWR